MKFSNLWKRGEAARSVQTAREPCAAWNGMLPLYTPTMVLFRCEVCGQIKLFDAEFFPPEEGGAEPEPRPEPEQRPEAPKAEPVPEPVQPKPFRPSRSRFGKKPPWEK